MHNRISRRELLRKTAQLGLAAPPALSLSLLNLDAIAQSSTTSEPALPSLRVPEGAAIPVAFLMSNDAVMIDFAGPWQVFQDVLNPSNKRRAFHLFTVGETRRPVRVSGGMQVLPDYSLLDAPAPRVIVIPAQSGDSKAMLDWVRRSARQADITMSVCTGAFLLAKTGLLDGLSATTHHGEYRTFQAEYPRVHLERGMRFVDEGSIASAGGLSSGIDLALHVVERYFGRTIAQAAADNMEYQGRGWTDAHSNGAYAVAASAREGHPVCIVCEMEADLDLHTRYEGKTYYFCSTEHQRIFNSAPAKFV